MLDIRNSQRRKPVSLIAFASLLHVIQRSMLYSRMPGNNRGQAELTQREEAEMGSKKG